MSARARQHNRGPHDALHTLLDELQPKNNGVLRRTGAGRVFATVTQLHRTKRPNRPDFIKGTAQCRQLRISVTFDSHALSTGNLSIGPVVLPPTDAQTIRKQQTVLYGMVVKTARGYKFAKCTPANQLYFFFVSAFEPVSFLVDNASALTVDGRHDLLALACMLHRCYDVVMDPLERCKEDPELARSITERAGVGQIVLSHAPADFALLTSIMLRDPSVYRGFIDLVQKRKKRMHRDLASQVLHAAVPAACVKAFSDQRRNAQLTVFLELATAPQRAPVSISDLRAATAEKSDSELSV